jgi:O-antigen ligase
MIPLIPIPLGGSRVYFQSDVTVGYFPNANTAALYYTALLFSCFAILGRLAIALQVLIAVAFGKVGVLVATGGAIAVWRMSKLNVTSIIGGIAASMFILAATTLGLLDRQIEVLSSLVENVRELGFNGIASSSFAELVQIAGSSDVSGYFRIVHWSDILKIYGDGGVLVWLFGYGAGQTPLLTTLALVPHNDYLKVLAEFGLVSFLTFTFFLSRVLFEVKQMDARILLTILFIYFFSENLINNFASMALFFGFAGMLAREHPAFPLPFYGQTPRWRADALDPNLHIKL